MRILTAIMVAVAVLATSVVSVRLHLHVAQLRYRVEGLESQRVRAEREMRMAQAELEAAKAPRRLMERWDKMHGGATAVAARSGLRPVAPVRTEPDPADVLPADPSTDEGAPREAGEEAGR